MRTCAGSVKPVSPNFYHSAGADDGRSEVMSPGAIEATDRPLVSGNKVNANSIKP